MLVMPPPARVFLDMVHQFVCNTELKEQGDSCKHVKKAKAAVAADWQLHVKNAVSVK
jgi:hypothetical protein